MASLDTVSVTLKTAVGFSVGARFFTCALQVNPHAYILRHKNGSQPFAAASKDDYDAAMVKAAVECGIEVVAITDHFRVDQSESLRAAFEAAGIVVFPGFEACSSEGVHLLCLHAPGTELSRLQTYVGECQLRDPDALSPQSRLGCEDLMRMTADRGGLTIAAHVTNTSGLLTNMKGGARIGPWKSEHLAAAAIPGPVEDTPPEHRSILQNKNPNYLRDRALALVNAADVSDPSGFARAGVWTRIKMAEPTIDGLRQAFLAADSRVSLSSQTLADDSAEIAAIAWDGGFLDGQAIRFNNGLNVLVGGRGAGKSLVIESLRYAMGATVAGKLAKANHEALTKRVLGPSTKVSVLVRDPLPSRNWYIVERTGNANPIVRGADGAVISGLDPMSLVEGLEIYGQHELSELTRDKELLAQLLSRYIQQQDLGTTTSASLPAELASSRSDIEARLAEIERLDEEVGSLPGLRHQLAKMDELGAREMLQERIDFQKSVDENLARKEALDQLKSRSTRLEADLRRLSKDHPDEEGYDTMSRIGRLGGDQTASLSQTIDGGLTEIGIRIASLEAERPDLEKRLRSVEGALKAAGIDAGAYERTASAIMSLEGKEAELRDKRAELVGFREKRDSLLDRLVEKSAEQLRLSERAAKKAGRELKGRVRVTVRPSKDLSELSELLSEHVDGAGPKNTLDRLAEREDYTFRDLAKAVRDGADALRDRFRLTETSARNVAAAGEALALRIEELKQAPAADIELNVGDDGAERWKPIENLSAGQKATAVLLLLLGGSVSPLVIDQPEDDLDNRFIADTIVGTMRNEKRRRQFIFSSHNANIPVLGDAEQIVTLRPGVAEGREHSEVSHGETGSIDQKDVRAAVERLLEGGRAAFELRRAKYGY